MYDNIGEKLKNWAKALCVLGIIASVITAIVLWSIKEWVRYEYVHPYILHGFIVLILGSLFSWTSTWVMYAIGHAAENSDRQVSQNGMLQIQNEKLLNQNEEILKLLKKMNGETSGTRNNQQTAHTQGKPVQKEQAQETTVFNGCQDCVYKDDTTAEYCNACPYYNLKA